MKKRLICWLLALALAVSLAPGTAFASSVVETGSCGYNGGDNVTYTLYDDGLMTISGSGAMENWSGADYVT